MRPSEVLIKAKAKIAIPEKWSKTHLYNCEIEKDGKPNMDKQTHCSLGAIYYLKDTSSETRSDALGFLYEALGATKRDGLVEWNDAPERKHKEVLALFDKAIEIAKAKEVQI